MAKLKKDLGLWGVIVSFFFLFNPNINIIDILPDFFGYAIIYFSLSKISELNDDISEARKGFLRMIVIDIVKFCSIFMVFGMSYSQEQNTMLLLFSLVFAVIEMIVLLPAYNNLFGGLLALGYRYPNKAVVGSRREGTKKNYTDKAKKMARFFVIFKAAMYALPEFSVLGTQSYDESAAGMISIYEYIGLLRSMSIFATFICGIIWLAVEISYFRRVLRDKEFIGAISDEFREKILPKDSIFTRKTLKVVFFMFCVAAFLCFDLRLDDKNVLPDILAAIVLAISAFVIRKQMKKVANVLIPFVVYTFAAVGAEIAEYRFFSEYFYSAVDRNDAAYSAYTTMLLFSLVKAVGFLIAVWGITNVLRWVIENHTGFSVPEATVRVDDKIAKVHKSLNKKIYIVWASAIVCAASDLFYDFGTKNYNFAGIVNTVGVFIFFITIYAVTSNIMEEVESKYILE